MNTDNSQEEAIRFQVTEQLKRCLTNSILVDGSSLRAMKAEPEGQLSVETVDLLRDLITPKQYAQLASEMEFWWVEEYQDCLDITQSAITYAGGQKDRLLNLLTPPKLTHR